MNFRPVALVLSMFLPASRQIVSWGQSNATTNKTAAPDAAIHSADAAFREGYAAYQSHDLAAARIGFEKAVRLAPRIAATHAALGAVLLALGYNSGAVRELEQARTLDRQDSATLLNLCVAYTNSNDYVRAIAAYRDLEVAAASGQNVPDALPPDAAVAVATALAATHSVEEAQAVLQRSLDAALAGEHDDARLEDAMGTLLAQQRAYQEAELHLRRAVALDDTLAAARFHLGELDLATNRPAEAVAELGRAHTLEPAGIPYTLELARAQMANGQDDLAIVLLQAALSNAQATQPSQTQIALITEIKYRLALALQSAEDAKQALPLFDAVVNARPDDAETLTNAGLAHVQVGDAKSGVELYLRALKLRPSDPTLREDLGVAYLQQADLDHALEQFRAGLALDGQSPQLHYDLGLALKLRDDLAGAIPEFQRAAELDPQLPDPPYTLGVIFMQQGQFEKAAASLEKATLLRPGNGDAWALLGSVYQQLQQPDKAVPALRQAIALLPAQPSPHITLAAILSAQGHKDEAAAERKLGANLTRVAVNRQKANFGLDSGNLLMKRGQTDDALVQFQSAVDADPNYQAARVALAAALDRAGRKAEAAEERRKAAGLESTKDKQ